jgi:putative Holliday junction resolvase
LDVGQARIGIAICDPEGILAVPLEAIARLSDDETLEALSITLTDFEIIEFYVGDPISLSGKQTASTNDAREFAASLAKQFSVPVRLVDERLTTVSAAARLRESGKNAKSSKALIDSASAVVILEAALRTESLTGEPAGLLVGA